MQKTKVTLIYWGLCLFIFLALIPWIFNPTVALYSIQALVIYGAIVTAFLGGIVWGNSVISLFIAILLPLTKPYVSLVPSVTLTILI